MDIRPLLPQKNSMCLLDSLETFDSLSHTATASFSVRPDHLFFDDSLQGIPVYVSLELMAQCVAALSNAVYTDNPVQIGLLLGSRKLSCFYDIFPLSETFYVSVSQSFYDSQTASFSCQIHDHTRTVLYSSAELIVFHPDNPDDFLTLIKGN